MFLNVRQKRSRRKKSKQRKLLFGSFVIIFLSAIIFLSVIGIHRLIQNKPIIAANNTEKIQSLPTKNDIDNVKATEQIDSNITEEPIKSDEPLKKVSESEVLISFVGDCTIGTDEKFDTSVSLPTVFRKNSNDYNYFFKNVVSFFANDDITVANLETTFTNSTAKADKEFTFKAPPEYAKTLTAGHIEGVNISNNHIYDYLNKGFVDTKTALNAEHINFFGEGNKWVKEVNGIKFGFLGYSAWSNDSSFLKKVKTDIQALKDDNCLVIINFHWGEENKYTPNEVQKSVAHYAIDNGADVIIGHHPHVIQGIEMYKNKMICYSLGNFCFGGNSNPYDKDTFIVQVNFKFQDSNLTTCGFRVIPCSISSLDSINDYCPTPMNTDKKNQFLAKLNKLSFNLNFQISDEFNYVNMTQ